MPNHTNNESWSELERIQNCYFPDQDILTITGFMTDEQFYDHVARYQEAAEKIDSAD